MPDSMATPSLSTDCSCAPGSISAVQTQATMEVSMSCVGCSRLLTQWREWFSLCTLSRQSQVTPRVCVCAPPAEAQRGRVTVQQYTDHSLGRPSGGTATDE